MDNKLVMISIAAVIGIIVLGSVLMPILDDAIATTDTYENKGVFYVEVNPTDSYSIKYNKATESGVLYINDEPLTVDFSTGFTVLAIDNAILRVQSSDNTLQYKGNGSYLTGINVLDITVSGGSITGTFSNSNQTGASWPTTAYTKCFIGSPDKESNVMKSYSDSVKMNGDSGIIAFGQTPIHSSGSDVLMLINITGNIEDGVAITLLNSSTGAEYTGAVASNISINKTDVTDHIDLYDLASITFTVTYDGATTDCTYSAFVVPSEVTAERAQHFTPGQNAIFAAMPVMIILAILLGVVALVIRSRMD